MVPTPLLPRERRHPGTSCPAPPPHSPTGPASATAWPGLWSRSSATVPLRPPVWALAPSRPGPPRLALPFCKTLSEQSEPGSGFELHCLGDDRPSKPICSIMSEKDYGQVLPKATRLHRGNSFRHTWAVTTCRAASVLLRPFSSLPDSDSEGEAPSSAPVLTWPEGLGPSHRCSVRIKGLLVDIT